MAEPKLIKICLTNRGEDTETPWAAELGPAPNAPPNSLRVKLVNVPFMHAKPTWGDTIVVTPAADKVLTWDRDGVPWEEIAKRIVDDGGRWAMILDYTPHGDAADAMTALGRACDAAKIVCEGAWGPRDGDPAGRVYLAVQKELTAPQVMEILTAASLPLDLNQIHPEPKKRTPVTRAGTVVGISDEAGRPPAKPARAKTEKSTPVMDSARPGSRAALAAASSDVPAADAPPPPPAAVKPVVAKPAAPKPAVVAKPVAKGAPAKASKSPPPKAVAAKPASKAAKPAAKPAKPAAQPVAKKPTKPAAKKPVAKKPSKKK